MRIGSGLLYLVIILSVIMFSVFGNVRAEGTNDYQSGSSLYLDSEISTELLETGSSNFSEAGQEELQELARMFEYDERVPEQFISLNEIDYEIPVNEDIDSLVDDFSFRIFPGLNLEGDYNLPEDDFMIGLNPVFDLGFEVDADTMITANFEGQESLLSYNYQDGETALNTFYGADSYFPRTAGALDISHRASSNFEISAGYSQKDIMLREDGFTTNLGLKYIDNQGQISARYLLDRDDDSLATVTGMELGFRDLATLSASYKILNPDYQGTQSEGETSWDLGLDLNLNEFSRFSIGYQHTNEASFADDDELRENSRSSSNIEASFKIKF